jgi:ABC-type dipeptide/oligopeptide/nickel transport system ATPase subunit
MPDAGALYSEMARPLHEGRRLTIIAESGVGVEKVTVIRTLNGSKSMVKEGEISLPCFVGSPFSEAR